MCFQLGEGPSRGLLRDYEPLCGPSFQALVCSRGGAQAKPSRLLSTVKVVCLQLQSWAPDVTNTDQRSGLGWAGLGWLGWTEVCQDTGVWSLDHT